MRSTGPSGSPFFPYLVSFAEEDQGWGRRDEKHRGCRMVHPRILSDLDSNVCVRGPLQQEEDEVQPDRCQSPRQRTIQASLVPEAVELDQG